MAAHRLLQNFAWCIFMFVCLDDYTGTSYDHGVAITIASADRHPLWCRILRTKQVYCGTPDHYNLTYSYAKIYRTLTQLIIIVNLIHKSVYLNLYIPHWNMLYLSLNSYSKCVAWYFNLKKNIFKTSPVGHGRRIFCLYYCGIVPCDICQLRLKRYFKVPIKYACHCNIYPNEKLISPMTFDCTWNASNISALTYLNYSNHFIRM